MIMLDLLMKFSYKNHACGLVAVKFRDKYFIISK